MIATIINAMLGIWLMAAPSILGYDAAARTNDHIVGPLVATFAIIAAWEVMRGLRLVNLCLGVWLVVAPFLLGFPMLIAIHSISIGLVVGALALSRGRTHHRFDGGWQVLFRPRPSGRMPPAA